MQNELTSLAVLVARIFAEKEMLQAALAEITAERDVLKAEKETKDAKRARRTEARSGRARTRRATTRAVAVATKPQGGV